MHSFLPTPHPTSSAPSPPFIFLTILFTFSLRERGLYALFTSPEYTSALLLCVYEGLKVNPPLHTSRITLKMFLVNPFIANPCYTRFLDVGCVQCQPRLYSFSVSSVFLLQPQLTSPPSGLNVFTCTGKVLCSNLGSNIAYLE